MIYFNNEIDYLKELSNKDNHKNFNEIIQKKYNLLVKSLILLLIIILVEFISKYFNFNLDIFLIPLFFFSILNSYSIIIIMNRFLNCHNYFIKLCEVIVKYENIIKNKIKSKYMLKNQSNETELNIIEIINEMKKVTSINIKNNSNKNDLIKLFNEYSNQKQNLFKYIFINYQKEYIIKEIFIIKYLKYISNYTKSLNYQINHLINIFKENLKKFELEKINFEKLFKNYENYIKNNIINTQEKKIDELYTSINDIFISHYNLNEYFINLMKIINSDNEDKNEKIEEIIEYIIEKKKLSISLLKAIQNKMNNDNEIINNYNYEANIDAIQKSINNNLNIMKQINENDNKINNISLSDIQSNSNNNFHDKDKNNTNENIKYKKNYDFVNEEEKMKMIKADFIKELNEFCNSKKNLNKDDEIKTTNISNITKNDINKVKEQNNFNQMKIDFAKSLTMSLKKNKNFKFDE